MQTYVVKRFVHGILLLFAVAIVVFFVGRATGNPLDLLLPEDATAADREHMSQLLGLDQPYHVQLVAFLTEAAHGNFGRSIKFKRPAADLVAERLPNSLKLVVLAWGIAFLLGTPLAVAASVNKDGFVDNVGKVVAIGGMALPSFLVGLLLMQLFALRLGILPVSGLAGPSHYVLPALTLAFSQIAGLVRLLRSSMLDVLGAEFVKLARIKGVSEKRVIWKHCLRNAFAVVVSYAGVQIAVLITGAVVVETVFGWPGLGRLAYDAVLARDYPLIQAVILSGAVIIVLANAAADVLYAYLDPRIRIA